MSRLARIRYQKRKKRAQGSLFSTSVAEWTGLEPATPGVTGRYSNQLNYHSYILVLHYQERALNNVNTLCWSWWVLTGSNRRHSPCKGDALPTELSTLHNQQRPLVYSIFKCFTSPELRRICCLDFNCCACARITTITCGALANIESTKTNQCNHIALFEGFCNGSSCCIQGTTRGSFGDSGSFGDLINQFRFVHV